MRAVRLGSLFLPLIALFPARAQDRGVAAAILLAHTPAHDDPQALALELLHAATQNAGSAASEILITEVERLQHQLTDRDVVREALARYLAAKPHALGEHAARLLDAQLLLAKGQRDAAKKLDPYASYVHELIAIGPFGDGGDYYSSVTFAPELRFPENGRKLAGSYGDVAPRVAGRKLLDRWIELEQPGTEQKGCFYGLHQFLMQNAAACYLEIGCRGSFEVFVNGVRAGSLNRHAERASLFLPLP